MLLTQYQKAMLSIVNESETKVFQQELLTVKIYPTLQQMGNEAAKEVADRICKLLEEKAEINMIFAAAPSQNEFLNHLIHDKRIDWTRINAFHMDEYIGIHPDAPQSFGHFLRIRIFDKVPFKKVNYLNGREIAFGIENEARPVKELEERVEQTTKDLHIEKLRNRNIFELSGGEKQKIAFASVYAMNPEIYLLDEPSSNLDMASIQELKEHLRLIKSQGKTILIAEHRLYYLMELADRIVYLEDGEKAG